MMDDENKLPTLKTVSEKEAEEPDLLQERKWYGTDTQGLLLDFSEPYTSPKWTLSHNGIPFAKLGDLHIVSGKAGHGKTSFMSQIIAAILKGRFCGMKSEFAYDVKPTVLYVDTEMAKDDTIAIKNRVCTMADMDYSARSERFLVARLRETVHPMERYKQILQLLWDIRPNVVFIDGLLDLVEDYNDQKECAPIIRELMVVASYYNISTWCVLHENPTTEKLVGSLGSIAQRKVTEVFTIRKHKAPHDKRFKDMNMPNVFFEVVQTKARGKDQEDWYFCINNEQYAWGMPEELGDYPKTSHTVQDILRWMNDAQTKIVWPATHTDIYKYILAPEGIGEDEQQEIMKLALSEGILIEQTEDEMSPRQRVPRLKFNEDKALPF